MGFIDHNLSLTWIQRRSILFLLILLAIGLTTILFYRRTHVPDEQLPHPARADEVADRIDINTADWPTLAVLPSIGEKRAKEIIAVREQLQAARPDRLPFESMSDLDRQVKGIGPATIAKLRPYLTFGPPSPATQNSGD